MAQLIRIGNSQGIRIPKLLLDQANFAGKELVIELVEGNGLLIRPFDKPRAGWAEKIDATLQAKGKEPLDQEWLDATLTQDD